MKTILIDAYNTLFTEAGIDEKILQILESFDNPKIVLTNADDEQIISFGITASPYPVFSLKHNPNKTEGGYYEKMLEHFNLQADNCLYIEHNLEAVVQAQKAGINTYYFDMKERDLISLKDFILKNI